ncbi:putative F-box/LRR-repeat protein At3g58880 [Papaver somniferum]|uniref:putative F-box/LRR-repeat protein At3g58880 n=1 Tax=Papaver somniferum TaxID=3469 RepID=UPI000E6F709A|nr:putative F-box/LRR-repeat protein At3g58880 [Papaver somniferum]
MQESKNSQFASSIMNEEEKEEEEEKHDRFDSLPDDLIHLILFYFNDTRDVVRKFILISKRWLKLCKSLPFLIFYRASFPQDEELHDQNFIDFVDMVLLHHQDSPIFSFTLHWFYSSDDDAVIRNTNRWIHAALQRDVQELVINTGQNEHFTYNIPYKLLNAKQLRKLRVNFFCVSGYSHIVLPDRIHLPNLKYLWLAGLSISDESLTKKLLSSCPLLETLELHDCDMRTDNKRTLTVDCPNLQRFEFVHLFPHVLSLNNTMARVLRLTAPNLQKFTCRSFFGQAYCLENCSPLSDVSFEMVLEDEDDASYKALTSLPVEIKKVYVKRVMQFIRTVCKVKSMTLSSGILEVLSLALDMPDLQPPGLCNLQCLKIEMAFTKSSLRALAYLLKITPIVDSVFLVSEESNLEDAGDEWGEGMVLPRMLSHLKFIQIEGMEGCDNELRALQYLLRNAKVLMEVQLVFCSFVGAPEVEQFVEKVRGLPTTSSNMTITKKQDFEEGQMFGAE